MNNLDMEDITKVLHAAGKGGETVLPKGIFQVRESILLGDDCLISGSGERETTLVLGNDVNNNMFTNISHKRGNKNITLKNLSIDGNQAAQHRPATEKRLSFCNILYLAHATNCTFLDLSISNVLQTALHFSFCRNINISNLHASSLGWSGISTTGTRNVVATAFHIEDSGNDHRHSAVHLDGGNCCFIQGVVRKCVGNGIMLDSRYSELKNCVVQVEAYGCMRGIALIGGDAPTHSVSIHDSIVARNGIGIMVSNAHSAFINNTRVESSSEVGILFRGRMGGFDSFVSNCRFSLNKVNISQINASKNNVFVNNEFVE